MDKATTNQSLWETVHASRKWGAYPPEEIVRFIAHRYVSLPKEARKSIRILDLGCGQGAVTWFLAREGFSVTGIDAAPSAIQKAQEYLSKNNLQATFVVGDLRQLPFPDGTFDCVLDIESIYTNQAADIARAYEEVHRVLRKGGAFFTMSFSTACSNFGTGKKLEEHTFTHIPHGSPHTGVAHYFDRTELLNLLEKNRFSDIVIDEKSITQGGGKEKIVQWIAYGTT